MGNQELRWTSIARADYLSIKRSNQEKAKRIDRLLEHAMRSQNTGLGNPVALKGSLKNCYSRRIDAVNRLVYYCQSEAIVVIACRYQQ